MSMDSNLQSAFNAVGSAVKARIPSSEKGQPNGVATLDGAGKIPSTQLPSYIDDVLEYVDLASFPIIGSSGVLYVDLTTNKQYRWAGSTYQQITSGAVDSVAGKTGVITLVKADVGLSNVDNTSDANKNVLSATKWTDARTITIGSTGKSIDGSTNLGWTLTEIGAQPIDADLTAIAGLVGTSGLLKKTATDTWMLDTNSYALYSDLSTLSNNVGSTTTDFVAVFNAALI